MFTPVELDKVRNFRYGMKAISLIEKRLNVKSIGEVNFDNLSMEETATLIWAGLVHEDTELTPDKVMDLVDQFSDISTVAETMGKAMESSFGSKEGK